MLPPPMHTAAHVPPAAPVPDVGRTVAAALAWRIERTPIVPLRGEVAEAATWRPVEVRHA